jgi:oligopeptide transport system ATP-binding protein
MLEVRDLSVTFRTPAGEVAAVSDVSLAVAPGECLGIVGESGSGKSQLFLGCLGLLAPNGRASGSARLDGLELIGLGDRALEQVRGARASMVFQDPMSALTPHMRIGDQLAEVLTTHRRISHAEALERAQAALARVQIPEPARRLRQYPHELSGGMRQRVMIAMAVLCEPELLIADEPTTALDVTVQAQILDLLRELTDELRTALVLITHDLGVVAGIADQVAVMYAGRIVEQGPVERLLTHPAHPYTCGLLDSMPDLAAQHDLLPLGIAGQPPDLGSLPPGCAFEPRCASRGARCRAERPALVPRGSGTAVACWHPRGLP